MKLIIDAGSFNGFRVDGIPDRVFSAGFIEVKKRFKFPTFWGEEIFEEGDVFAYVDIAACISRSNEITNSLRLEIINAIILRVVHELSHWAGGRHEKTTEGSNRWSYFLSSLYLEGNVK